MPYEDMKIYRNLWEDRNLYKDLCKGISNVYKGKILTYYIPVSSSESLDLTNEPVLTGAIKVLEKLAKDTDEIGILNQIWRIYNKLFDCKFETLSEHGPSKTNLIPTLDKKIQEQYLKLHREKSVTPMTQ